MLETLIHLDHQLFDLINQGMSNSFFDFIMPYIRNKYTWIPLYFFLVLIIFKKWKWKAVYILILALLLIACTDGLSSHVIKPWLARTRPCLLEGFMGHINLILEKCSGAYSMPSSHAANHFALAIFIGFVFESKVLRFSLLLWAFIISFAQVYVGVHFPADVLVGALLGTVMAWLFLQIKKAVIKTAF